MSGESLKLDRLQRDVIAPQIDALLAAVSDPESRERYLALKEAVDRFEVPPPLLAPLGALAEMSISSGRVRRTFGPGAELALWSLFQKTPRGREIAASVASLNAALKQIEGQALESVSATMRGPGAYALTVKTAQCQLAIRFDSAGVRVESLEVDLG
jgi:hypothetical protein